MEWAMGTADELWRDQRHFSPHQPVHRKMLRNEGGSMARLRAHCRGQSCRGFPQVFQPKQCDVSVSIHPPPPSSPSSPPSSTSSFNPSILPFVLFRPTTIFGLQRAPFPQPPTLEAATITKAKGGRGSKGGGISRPIAFLLPAPLPSSFALTIITDSFFPVQLAHFQQTPIFPRLPPAPPSASAMLSSHCIVDEVGTEGGKKKAEMGNPHFPQPSAVLVVLIDHPPLTTNITHWQEYGGERPRVD
jgi:hypothetical protein